MKTVLSIIKCFIISFMFISSVSANDIVVTTIRDDDPPLLDDKCSLREAIEAANTNSAVDSCAAGTGAGSDQITFFVATPSEIKLVDELDPITDSLIIRGLGSNNLSIDGDNSSRHFEFSGGPNFTYVLEHITLKNGRDTSGGSLLVGVGNVVTIDNVVFDSNVATNGGGAIRVDNALTGQNTLNIRRSTFSNNSSGGPSTAGAVSVGRGSAVDVSESTFINNSANGSQGGAIAVSGGALASTLTINLSTFFGNQTSRSGSAITSRADLTTITNTTIIGNTANINTDSNITYRGAVDVAEVSLKNTIIAGNLDNSSSGKVPNLYVGGNNGLSMITSNGFNLIGTNTTFIAANGDVSGLTAGSPNADNDWIGTDAVPIDPSLLAIAMNGGPTATMAIPDPAVSISPALDKGECTGDFNDQRSFGVVSGGIKRAFDVASVAATPGGGDNCDIGAFEFGTINLVTDRDFDGVVNSADTCPDHFDPDQELVCELEPESLDDPELCTPIKSINGNIAVVCI
ncbi:MAG: choice-of-anchor Q domain-containing protein [Pseudomonadota bacterium]